MPHAVFEPAPELETFWRAFTPFKEVRPDRTILEARSSYLRHDHGSVIIEAFAFELGPPQHFFVICDGKGERMTVRCAPLVPVSRSDGVVEIVRRIAIQVRDAGGVPIRTNLDLDAPVSGPLGGGDEPSGGDERDATSEEAS